MATYGASTILDDREADLALGVLLHVEHLVGQELGGLRLEEHHGALLSGDDLVAIGRGGGDGQRERGLRIFQRPHLEPQPAAVLLNSFLRGERTDRVGCRFCDGQHAGSFPRRLSRPTLGAIRRACWTPDYPGALCLVIDRRCGPTARAASRCAVSHRLSRRPPTSPSTSRPGTRVPTWAGISAARFTIACGSGVFRVA